MDQANEVKAAILDYCPNAMHDNFEGGGFASYDATKIRILSPKPYAGMELLIYHNGEIAEDSLWRAIGKRVVFELRLEDLRGEMTLFDGAVSGLRADRG